MAGAMREITTALLKRKSYFNSGYWSSITIILRYTSLIESHVRNALFPVKAVYYAGYICVVESNGFN